jgi:hypothetical protein
MMPLRYGGQVLWGDGKQEKMFAVNACSLPSTKMLKESTKN